MALDYSKMTEQEALDILQKEWPEYSQITEKRMKEGKSMVQWLSTLESFA